MCLGNALLRRLVRVGVLDESRMKLDYVLGLKIEDFLERRLQTQVSSSILCIRTLPTSCSYFFVCVKPGLAIEVQPS